MSSDPTPIHFYHRIADAQCAQTRTLLATSTFSKLGILRYRNVDTGPEALADLIRLSGGDRVPFLHDTISGQIYSGKEEIARFIAAQ